METFENILEKSVYEQGVTLELHYENGDVLNGFISKLSRLSDGSLYVILCQSTVPRGEDPHHEVDIEDLVKVVVKKIGEQPIVYTR